MAAAGQAAADVLTFDGHAADTPVKKAARLLRHLMYAVAGADASTATARRRKCGGDGRVSARRSLASGCGGIVEVIARVCSFGRLKRRHLAGAAGHPGSGVKMNFGPNRARSVNLREWLRAHELSGAGMAPDCRVVGELHLLSMRAAFDADPCRPLSSECRERGTRQPRGGERVVTW